MCAGGQAKSSGSLRLSTFGSDAEPDGRALAERATNSRTCLPVSATGHALIVAGSSWSRGIHWAEPMKTKPALPKIDDNAEFVHMMSG
jgi:hypothetical protein